MKNQAIASLLVCLGNASDSEKKEKLAGLTAEEWHAVTAKADEHSLAPLLYSHLTRLELPLPDSVGGWLKESYRRNWIRNATLYRELGRVLAPLQERGIPVIILKGAHLAACVYQDIGVRQMLDVDLLARQEDLATIDQVLVDRGFEPFDRHRSIGQDNCAFAYRLPGRGLDLEVHWAIVPLKYKLSIDMDGFWTRARSTRLLNISASVLSSEDLLLDLCVHAAKDSAARLSLKILCDLNQLVHHVGAHMDWQMVSTQARDWGVAKPVYVFLRLARELLGTPLPTAWLETLRPAKFQEPYLNAVRDEYTSGSDGAGHDLMLSHPLAQLWSSPSVQRRILIFLRGMFVSRDTMSRLYPAPANSVRIFFYYPVRMKDVLIRYGNDLWQLVRGDESKRAIAAHTGERAALHDWLISTE